MDFAARKNPARVFISYCREDARWMDRLQHHLALLRHQGVVFWEASEVDAGSDWYGTLERKVEDSQIFVIFVSADYLASKEQHRILLRALDRHKAGDAVILPIITTPCDWQSTPLNSLQVLPEGGKPLVRWQDPNEVLEQIAELLKRTVDKLPGRRRTTALWIGPAHAGHLVPTIRHALEANDVTMLRWDKDAPVSRIFADAIDSSDLIIADLTSENPNVMYELGYAHALRKQTILLLNEQDKAGIPADLAGYLFLTYDPSNLDRLNTALQRAISRSLKAA
jgi:hypothetical protein